MSLLGIVVQSLELGSHLLQIFQMISNHHQMLSDVRASRNTVKITIWKGKLPVILFSQGAGSVVIVSI